MSASGWGSWHSQAFAAVDLIRLLDWKGMAEGAWLKGHGWKGRAFRHAVYRFVLSSRAGFSRRGICFRSAEELTKGEVLQGLNPNAVSESSAPTEATRLPMSDQTNIEMSWSKWMLAPLAFGLSAAAVPHLLTRGYPAIAFPLQHAFSLVCHQQPERSFYLFGSPVAVCARCLGIYLGATVGLLLQTSRRIALRLLIVIAALNLFDGVAESVGLHGNLMTLRFVLGVALGAAGALLISSSLPRTPSQAVTIS